MKILQRLELPFRLLVKNWDLYGQLFQREVQTKYKGSYLGMLWNFITPIFMLIIYTFVFGVVFQARWENQLTGETPEFALTLFAGIIMYTFFSEAINRAPSIISSNANYVKKVIFPLELLSMAHVGSLLIQMGISTLIILLGKLFFLHMWDFYFLLFPFIVMPLLFFALGLSWFFSALGVFVKDLQQIASIVVLILGYMTPVFYPVTLVPENVRWIMYLNPLTPIVESGRKILIYRQMPTIKSYFFSTLICYTVMILGFEFFRKVKTEFADVL